MLKYDPSRHHIIHCEVSDFLNREFPDKDLSVLHNKRAGSFEVVRPSKKPGHMDELSIIGDHPTKFTKEHLAEIRCQLDPAYRKSLARNHKRHLEAEATHRYEEDAVEVDKWRFMAKRARMLYDHPSVLNRAGLR